MAADDIDEDSGEGHKAKVKKVGELHMPILWRSLD